jgi:hypothetical protein
MRPGVVHLKLPSIVADYTARQYGSSCATNFVKTRLYFWNPLSTWLNYRVSSINVLFGTLYVMRRDTIRHYSSPFSRMITELTYLLVLLDVEFVGSCSLHRQDTRADRVVRHRRACDADQRAYDNVRCVVPFVSNAASRHIRGPTPRTESNIPATWSKHSTLD